MTQDNNGLHVRAAADGKTIMILDPAGKLVAVMADHPLAGALAPYFARAPKLAEVLAHLHNNTSPEKVLRNSQDWLDSRMDARGVLKGLL